MSLRKKLIIIFGLLIVIIISAFSVTSYISTRQAYIGLLKNELGKVVEGVEHLTDYYNNIARSEESILKLKDAVRSLKIGESGYPYVMNSDGDLLIHPKLEGNNLLETKDVYGFAFIKDIISKKNGETIYYWANPKDPNKIEQKIAIYSYYEPLDWYLVASITVDEFMTPVDQIRNLLLLMALIFLIISVGIVLYVANSISVPVMKIASELKNATSQVDIAAKDVAGASQRISQITTEQASNIEETSSSLEEIAGMVSNNVESAEQSSAMSHDIVESSQKGFSSVSLLIESMKEILDSNENIQKLSEVISEIADKTKVIDEIVFQTKLLSFNASVEAERAGEHGRGFAVVAQEVGNLAQMSGKAALEISTIVRDSVKKTETITSTNKEKVDKGNVLVKEAAEILKEIKEKSVTMQTMAQDILKASKEQSTGVAQINQAVSELDKSIQNNAANSEETAAAGEELSGQSQMMQEIVARLSAMIEGHVGVSAMKNFSMPSRPTSRPSAPPKHEIKPTVTAAKKVAPIVIPTKVEQKQVATAKPVQNSSSDDDWTTL